ncbi:MAG: ATP-dependent DNA helicase [Burkholderiales bacterium]|nr:ATP-dependent DNA helicase [Burkholderiales bacterium]MDP2398302.1 ATP-dependent DNA helicase [Burkholderiales bacterium]
MSDLASVFSATGALAQVVPGFRARTGQLEMAEAIKKVINNQQVIVAEAGTGTGKTFAYLVPALLSGGKVIISTGTKTLQDQLFGRDIPVVRDAMLVPVTVALLKGRANYVCHHHLERAKNDGRLPTRDDVMHLARIESFARISITGDRADCAEVPENAGVWPLVTSTRDNCLGSQCEHYDKCFVMKARKQALESDVVVVNHHLFFADVMLREESVAELLPACNTVIFDEAHQLPETASLFFGQSVSTTQLLDLARDARIEGATVAKDFAALPAAANVMEKAARDLRLAFEDSGARMPAALLRKRKEMTEALEVATERLTELAETLHLQAARSEGLQKCFERADELRAQLAGWREDKDASLVRWVEVFHQSVQFNATPLSIAEIFRKQVEAQAKAWVFTSATLSVNGDFSHYVKELGIEAAQTASWASPFDFEKQGLLYVPQGLPEPNTPDYTAAVVDAVLPAVGASRGRAFLLFTSLRAMREAQALLAEAFSSRGWDYPLLVQGEGSRSELLERFRALGNAVLIGSQSFWEGVDVRGEALSLVMIDKLPFAPPDDPVLAARIEKINAEGRNAFMEHQLPRAVISLKQGAGRLIRDEADRGVLMICDPRLISKSYGKRIWRSLPPMTRTRDVADVVAFFAQEPVPALA